jgi:acetate kinase
MNILEMTEFLKARVPLFGSFDDHALEALVKEAREVTFEAHEAIIEFGEKGRFFGVLLDGEARVSTTDDSGAVHELSRIGGGSLFGEMAMMTGQKTMADVIGITRCRVLLFSPTLFVSKLMTNPSAVQTLARILAERSKQLAYDEDRRALEARAAKKSADPYGFSLAGESPQMILVVNCGSSSLKYRLFDTEHQETRVLGLIERIGLSAPVHHFEGGRDKVSEAVECPDHAAAFGAMLDALTKGGHISSAADITAVGHRVVHGGERFSHAARITDEVLAEIDALSVLAPLHNPVNAKGIRLAKEAFPLACHVAVFDTSFHHTLPSYAYLYGLPKAYHEKKGVRRYGFHGTSHAYVSLKAAQFLSEPYNALEIITCHLGNGASVCAVDHGRSIDTSMGMTPTAGLVMGTRSGDVDPGALSFLMKTEELDAAAMDALINKQSGFLGLSGLSSDMRELETAAAEGHGGALVAIKTFCYQLRKTIGAYVAAMQGLDCLVFTGGIGENSAGVRSLACQGLNCMGIAVDERLNQAAAGTTVPVDIATEEAKVRVLVVPTNEELMIARYTLGAVERMRSQENLESAAKRQIPIEVSAHHVHLSKAHVAALFGEGHALTPAGPLSQPGQFACEEKVTLVGPKGRVERVRVLGPERTHTQVEIAMTEQFKLGIHPPIRESGDIEDTPGILIEGPNGSVTLDKGVICAMRHIHMSPEEALRLGLRDRYVVRVVVHGPRELTFGDVVVRVNPSFALAMHIDTDEANAANIHTGTKGTVESIQSRG